MVSLRRRRLLGLCSEISKVDMDLLSNGRSSFLVQFPKLSDSGNVTENPIQRTKLSSVHPMLSVDVSQQINIPKVCLGSSNISGSNSSKEEQNQLCSGQEIKRRKRHRRKHFANQESCVMRGVYFKNMKWQAAIKVDKKQIHLGTVGSQEEAARLYDRAAFMCGREPNFELSEEEKQELRQFKWDEFLTMTRHAITSKKHQRRLRARMGNKSRSRLQSGDSDGEQGVGFSTSDDAEANTSIS